MFFCEAVSSRGHMRGTNLICKPKNPNQRPTESIGSGSCTESLLIDCWYDVDMVQFYEGKFWETVTFLWLNQLNFFQFHVSIWKGAAWVKAKMERSFANLCIQSIYCKTIIWWSICCWDAFHFNGKGSINNLWIRRRRFILLRGFGNNFRKGFGSITGCARFALAVINVRQNMLLFRNKYFKHICRKWNVKNTPITFIHILIGYVMSCGCSTLFP